MPSMQYGSGFFAWIDTPACLVYLKSSIKSQGVAECRRMLVLQYSATIETTVLKFCDSLRHSAIGVAEIEHFLYSAAESYRMQQPMFCGFLQHFTTFFDFMEVKLDIPLLHIFYHSTRFPYW